MTINLQLKFKKPSVSQVLYNSLHKSLYFPTCNNPEVISGFGRGERRQEGRIHPSVKNMLHACKSIGTGNLTQTILPQ